MLGRGVSRCSFHRIQAGWGWSSGVCVAVYSRIATIVELLTARGMGRMLAG